MRNSCPALMCVGFVPRKFIVERTYASPSGEGAGRRQRANSFHVASVTNSAELRCESGRVLQLCCLSGLVSIEETQMAVKADLTKCDGCGDCVDSCPTEALKVENQKIVVNDDECSDCGACVDACEKGVLVLD
jgi:ferredoxin